MGKSFSFQAALKLNSKGFKKGVQEVQNSLSSLKKSFLSLSTALGAGLGFNQLMSNIKETATKLSVAKNTLENVSNVTKIATLNNEKLALSINNYAENLQFVRQLSETYSQDLVAVTDNYAKFIASCKKTTLGLDQQRIIFESLTRAAAYYHMSADQTKDMMNAITQMMSKGKVASEELRRQLGNSLPGAFNLMANAIGVSNAQLEEMMKQGKLLSSEALPKFATMLNTITQGANFDSLQLSMNKLKNTWYKLVENSGAENIFKNLVDGSAYALSAVANNFSKFKSIVIGIIGGIVAGNIFSKLINQSKNFYDFHKRALEEWQRRIVKTQSVLDNLGIHRNEGDDVYTPLKTDVIDKSKASKLMEYNNTLIEKYNIEKKIYNLSQREKEHIADNIKYLKEQNAMLEKMFNTTETNVKSTNKLYQTFGYIGNMIKNIAKSLASIGIMAIIDLIIGGIITIVSRMKDIRKEAERISNIFNEYLNGSNSAIIKSTQEQIALLESQERIVKNGNYSLENRVKAYEDIKKAIGASEKEMPKVSNLKELETQYDKITAAVKRWIEALKLQATIQYQVNQNASALAKIEELEAKKKTIVSKRKEEAKNKWKYNGVYNPNGGFQTRNLTEQEINDYANATNPDLFDFEGKDLQNINNEIEQLNKVVTATNSNLDALGVKLSDLKEEEIITSGGGSNNEEKSLKGLAKVLDEYLKSKKELELKLKEGAVNQEQYLKELDNLNSKYYKEAAATGELAITDVIEKINKGDILSSMEQLYLELSKAAKIAAINVLTEDISSAMEKAMKSNVDEALKGLKKSFEQYYNDAQIEAESVDYMFMPKKKTRNNLFDFGKTNSDILGENLDIENQYINDLQSNLDKLIDSYEKMINKSTLMKDGIDAYSKAIADATKNAKSLEESMNFAKIQEKITDMKKSISESIYGGIKDVATSTDRLVRGFEEINRLANDPDSSGWEKFSSVFNLVMQTADSVIGILNTINTITELTNTLKSAEISKQMMLNAQLLTQKGLQQGVNTEKQKEVITELASASAKKIDTAASIENTAAKSGSAIAGATESGSKLPFPYNLIAIAAGVAAVIAALASISKFAKGGIVGGNSNFGDNNVVRANSGEMILTKGQQGNLFSMLSSGKAGAGQVEFKIRGTDLVGVINNAKSARHL